MTGVPYTKSTVPMGTISQGGAVAYGQATRLPVLDGRCPAVPRLVEDGALHTPSPAREVTSYVRYIA